MNMDVVILLIYISLVVSSAYGFCLFGWWWRKQKSAGAVYIYVMLLLFGIAYSQALCVWARIEKAFNEPTVWIGFIESWAFSTRGVLTLIAVLLIDINMSYRAFWKSKRVPVGRKSVEILGGVIEHVHLKDAEPVELRINGKLVEVAILRKATNEVAIILDAEIKEIV